MELGTIAIIILILLYEIWWICEIKNGTSRDDVIGLILIITAIINGFVLTGLLLGLISFIVQLPIWQTKIF